MQRPAVAGRLGPSRRRALLAGRAPPGPVGWHWKYHSLTCEQAEPDSQHREGSAASSAAPPERPPHCCQAGTVCNRRGGGGGGGVVTSSETLHRVQAMSPGRAVDCSPGCSSMSRRRAPPLSLRLHSGRTVRILFVSWIGGCDHLAARPAPQRICGAGRACRAICPAIAFLATFLAVL
jgi:hypothetical protein